MNTTTKHNDKAEPAVQLPVDLRDHFAGLAMQDMLTLCQQDDYGSDYLAHCAKNAYRMADAMLKERAK